MASPNTGSTTQTLLFISSVSEGVTFKATGTAAQTLTGISQTVTGLTLIAYAFDNTILATDNAHIEDTVLAEEYALARDSTTSIFVESVSSSANAYGTGTFEVDIRVNESAVASSNILANETTLLSSTIRADDKIAQTFSLSITEAVNATNVVTTAVTTLIEGNATVSDTVLPGATYFQQVTGTVRATDWAFTGQQELATGSATVTDELVHLVSSTESIAESANVVDSTTNWVVATESVYGTATATEALSFEGSVYNNTVIASAQASDWIWSKDFGAIAWVLNTKTGGLWNYDNFGFTSLAFHAGSLYATSPEGLFLLDAEDDDGRTISSVSKTGFLDFGTEEKKRISDIYVGYTGGDLECDVETYDSLSYTYEMEQRDADAPHNSRIKPGRGLSSRYWRFTLRNIGGADFQIQDVAVNIAKSNRRV